MRSAWRRMASSRSSTAPRTRIARPGPGNGWRPTISSGSPSSRPTCRTSSLNSSRSGSISANRMSSFNPPTLWCVLMVADGPLTDSDSITSGYSVPCTRNFASPPMRSDASSKTSMKVLPMIFRFFSGSSTPCSRSRKSADASTTSSRIPMCARKVRSTASRSPCRSSPVSTKMQVSWSPMARWTSDAATDESTPPERPQMTRSRRPPARGSSRSPCSMNDPAVQVGSQPQTRKRKLPMMSAPRTVCATSTWNCTP